VRENVGDGMVRGGDVERVDVREDRLFWLGGCSDHGWWLHH
jgi:hypothetical protein